MLTMKAGLGQLSESERSSFLELFDVVWVYHDNALEGEVYTPDELRTALTDRVVTVGDSSSAMVMKDIRAHKGTVDHIRREAERRTASPLLNLTKALHERLTLDPDDRPGRYRRNPQLQRTYFHEIAEPSRISYLLRKILAWSVSEDALREHPIEVACRVHWELIHIYPFEKNTGRVGRLLLNYMLLREGYAPAVIHAQDRQRYYEAFRSGTPELLTGLVHESIDNGIDSVLRRLRSRGIHPVAPRDMTLR
jgi:Fic family protein